VHTGILRRRRSRRPHVGGAFLQFVVEVEPPAAVRGRVHRARELGVSRIFQLPRAASGRRRVLRLAAATRSSVPLRCRVSVGSRLWRSLGIVDSNACGLRHQSSHLSNTVSRHHLDTVSDEDLYAVNFASELLCLRDQSYTLTNDVVLNKDDLNDLLSAVLCE